MESGYSKMSENPNILLIYQDTGKTDLKGFFRALKIKEGDNYEENLNEW
jgi:hypothetical protein